MQGEGRLTGDWPLRCGLALLALLSVAPLLAWVYGLGEFSTWYWRVAAPALIVLVVAAVAIARNEAKAPLHRAIVAGAVGGFVGTIAYDLFRLPFLAGGLRLLAPIDSYGVLLLDAVGSSGRTGMAGWFFHFANGVCFGIAYAVIAAGRHWGWGIAWAMVLETATVATPFASLYGLTERPIIIGIAYLAHLPYGYAVGRFAQQPEATANMIRDFAPRFGTTILFTASALALLLWQRPWSTSAILATGEAVAPGPSAVIHGNGQMSPSWVRVPVGGCAAIRNDTDRPIDFAGTPVDPGTVGRVCFDHADVQRVKIGGRAWSGGFVIVDGEQDR